MRFLIKTAFWLGLIAFFLPSAAPEATERPGVNTFGALLGAQEAISDLGGFCERAPTACAAGREVGQFVAARVGDGIRYAYSAATGAAPAATTTPPAAAAVASASGEPRRFVAVNAAPDPMATAAVAAEHVRRAAGLPPFGMPQPAGAPAFPQPLALAPAVNATPPPVAPAIPTPAPRA